MHDERRSLPVTAATGSGKLMMCGVEGNSLKLWTRFFLDATATKATSAAKGLAANSQTGDVWGLWEASCSAEQPPCTAKTAESYVGVDSWTSVLVLRSPAARLAAAYKKLCPKDGDAPGGVPDGFENTCPLFPKGRPATFDAWVEALGRATGPRRDRDASTSTADGALDPLDHPKLRLQSAACGASPSRFTHVLIEDSPEFVGRIRTILRLSEVEPALIDHYFPVGRSFKKGDGKLGGAAKTQTIIRSIYATDYALLATDAARATAPPEPPTVQRTSSAAATVAVATDSVDTAKSPARFCVAMRATNGGFTVEAVRDWSPHGVQRFWELVRAGFYDDDNGGKGGIGVFRNAAGFVSQFGIHGTPAIAQRWDADTIEDDPMVAGVGNYRGYITFAMAGPHSRGSQLFVNLRNNNFLDDRGGFPPIARCIDNCEIAYGFEKKYGENPSQSRLYGEGNAYLRAEFPDLDYFTGAKVTACPPPPVSVRCATTKGVITLAVHHEWAPHGAARFLRLIDAGYFNASVPLFRCLPGWLCQFGRTKNPDVTQRVLGWGPIDDDPQWLDLSSAAKPWMRKGLLSYAGAGPNTRWGEFFFATGNVHLGRSPWEVPFAELVGDVSFGTLDAFYTGYGELQQFGGGAPDQGRIRQEGAAYLDGFPDLDYITGCSYTTSAT